jgi:hypothetical protein
MVQRSLATSLALSNSARKATVALIVACAGLVAAGSAQAGFLEELFGGPSAAPDWPSPQLERRHAPPRRRVEVHRVMSVGTNASGDASAAGSSPKKPQFCSWQDEASAPHDRTEALMRDATLRAGDVIMTDEGVRVFAGRAACPHTVRDFQTLAEASRALPRGERMVLAAMEQATKAKRFGSAHDPIVASDPAGRTKP